MPVTKSGIGCSNMTPLKQKGFKAILEYLLNVVSLIFKKGNTPESKKPFIFIDINAGCGFNPLKPEEDGSPIIFLKEAIKRNIPYVAYFIDEKEEQIDILREKISNEFGEAIKSCFFFVGKHEDVIYDIIKSISVYPFHGLIYHDPNGEPSFDTLIDLYGGKYSSRLKKVDLLIRVNSVAIKRAKIAFKRPGFVEKNNQINKYYWLIKELTKGDNAQWTFVLGTNWPGINKWGKQGLYRIDSLEGKEILKTVDLTTKEREKEQKPIFRYLSVGETLDLTNSFVKIYGQRGAARELTKNGYRSPEGKTILQGHISRILSGSYTRFRSFNNIEDLKCPICGGPAAGCIRWVCQAKA